MLTSDEAVTIVKTLVKSLDADLDPQKGHRGRVRRYLKGDHDLPYMPRNAKGEYRLIATRSVTNWLPLISDTFTKKLFVDGYRPAKSTENAPEWTYWQRNGLDARQTITHRGALDYGLSYVLVLPGDRGPVIKPLSPLRTEAVYEDVDDDYPKYAIVTDGVTQDRNAARLVRLYDEEAEYTLSKPKGSGVWTQVGEPMTHGLGVTPLVRFRDRLDRDEAVGIIAPLITQQNRINETVFQLLIALQYASFRQRWATGLSIPTDERQFLDANNTVPNPNLGKPIEPFEAAVNRLWVTDNPEAKFGDFAQTATDGHLTAYMEAVKSLAGIAQISPHVLTGDLINLSAEALAAAEQSTQDRAGEFETIFGEAWEQVFRLASVADGKTPPDETDNDEAEVRWRDTEARALASTVDALGKMVAMLGVPQEAAWERIPGVTDQDVEAWKALKKQNDVFGSLLGDLNRQAQPAPPAAPATPATPAAPAPAGP